MRELVESVFLRVFDPLGVGLHHDSAVVDSSAGRLALTTDSYVVKPRFFPGGDIGCLAVYGTVNDLAMAGASPQWLSAGFVLEEGLEIAELLRVVESMQRAARVAGVQIVTGDTKVVERGKGDGIYINTAGVGRVPLDVDVCPRRMTAGDRILLSGDLGRHGVAVMSVREDLGFSTDLESDCATLAKVAGALASELGAELHCLRDLTRGGLSAALNELALDAAVDIHIREASIPVCDAVVGACEILGLDPLAVACEGRFIAVVPPGQEAAALKIMQTHDPAAVTVGGVSALTADRPGRVVVESELGAQRIMELLAGEQLPRIC